MKLKWSNEKLKGLAEPVKIAQHNYDWIFWLIIAGCSLAGLGYTIYLWQVM